jgi:hypothetical protein
MAMKELSDPGGKECCCFLRDCETRFRDDIGGREHCGVSMWKPQLT